MTMSIGLGSMSVCALSLTWTTYCPPGHKTFTGFPAPVDAVMVTFLYVIKPRIQAVHGQDDNMAQLQSQFQTEHDCHVIVQLLHTAVAAEITALKSVAHHK